MHGLQFDGSSRPFGNGVNTFQATVSSGIPRRRSSTKVFSETDSSQCPKKDDHRTFPVFYVACGGTVSTNSGVGACGVAMAFTRHGLLHLMSWIAILSLTGSTSGEVTGHTSATVRSVLRQLQSYEIIHLRPTKGFSTASIADRNGMHECDGCCL